MTSTLRCLAMTAATTFIATPLVRETMLGRGIMDIPNHRSSHRSPIPRGGGLGVALGIATAVTTGLGAGTAAAITALGAVGMADDLLTSRGGLSAKTRLASQVAVGAALGARSGASGALLGAIVTPGIVNVVNFMDGINGMTGLTSTVWGLGAIRSTHGEPALIGAAVAGSGLGFLPWNAPKARIFLGDSGSYVIGAAMSAAVLAEYRQSRSLSRAATVASPLLPYAADAATTIVRRARRGDALGDAHREHTYQRLIDNADLDHSVVAAGHAGVAAMVGLLWRPERPLLTAVTTGSALAAYLSSPMWIAAVRRWMGR